MIWTDFLKFRLAGSGLNFNQHDFQLIFFVKLIQFDLSLRSNLKSLVYSSEFYLRIVGVVFSFTLTLKKLSRPRNSDAILLGSKLCFRRMKFVT